MPSTCPSIGDQNFIDRLCSVLGFLVTDQPSFASLLLAVLFKHDELLKSQSSQQKDLCDWKSRSPSQHVYCDMMESHLGAAFSGLLSFNKRLFEVPACLKYLSKSNETLSQDERRYWETEAATLRDRLRYLDDLARDVTAEKVRTEYALGWRVSSLAAVRTLPSDVLSEIFAYGFADPMNPSCRDALPRVISQVCSRWRAVALATPSSWTQISIDTDQLSVLGRGSSKKRFKSLIKYWISRSGIARVDLELNMKGYHIRNEDDPANRIFKYLMGNLSASLMGRLASLTVTLQSMTWPVLRTSLRYSWNTLERLVVRNAGNCHTEAYREDVGSLFFPMVRELEVRKNAVDVIKWFTTPVLTELHVGLQKQIDFLSIDALLERSKANAQCFNLDVTGCNTLSDSNDNIAMLLTVLRRLPHVTRIAYSAASSRAMDLLFLSLRVLQIDNLSRPPLAHLTLNNRHECELGWSYPVLPLLWERCIGNDPHSVLELTFGEIRREEWEDIEDAVVEYREKGMQISVGEIVEAALDRRMTLHDPDSFDSVWDSLIVMSHRLFIPCY